MTAPDPASSLYPIRNCGLTSHFLSPEPKCADEKAEASWGGRTINPRVALLVAWLRLLFLWKRLCRRRLSGGGRMSAERIIPHLVINPAGIGSTVVVRGCAFAGRRRRIVNCFSVFVDVTVPITKVYVNEHIGGSGSSLVESPTRAGPSGIPGRARLRSHPSELFAVLAGVGFASVNIADVSSGSIPLSSSM